MYPKELLAAQSLAGALMASCLFCASGVGILAAILRIGWQWRVGMAILLLSPLLAMPAVEIFWMLSLQIVLVVIGVQVVNCLLFRRAAYSTANDRSRSPGRFTIASLLFATAIAAGGVIVIKHTPALNGAAWRSLALIAFVSSLCVVIAWTATHLKWRGWIKWPLAVAATSMVTLPLIWLDFLLPSVTLQGWQGWPPVDIFGSKLLCVDTPTFVWLAITWAILLWLVLVIRFGRPLEHAAGPRLLFLVPLTLPSIALLGWTYFQLIPLPPQANGLPDEHEAFDRVMALSKRIENSRLERLRSTHGELRLIPAQELEAALKPLEDDLSELVDELRRPITVRLAYDDSDLNDFPRVRLAASALLGLGKVRASDQRPDEAMEACLAAVKLGVKTRRGGLRVHELVGRAVTATALGEVYLHRNSVSNEERAKVYRELIQLIGQLETMESIEARDRHWTSLQGWNSRLQLLISDTAGLVSNPTLYQDIRNTEATEMWLLVLELTLSSYFTDHGRLPEHLEVLIPAYLSELPSDPFARPGQGFQYSATSAGYQLYSVGENGIDDGGMAHPSDQVSGMVDRKIGDIMFFTPP